MEINFRSTKLQKIFESNSNLKRKYGTRRAMIIASHMNVIESLPSLARIPTVRPIRCHQLREDRDEQFAIDIVHPYRLVFEVDHDPIPRDEFGGIDRERVTAIKIMEMIDYH